MTYPCPPLYSFVSINNTPPCLPTCPSGLYTSDQYLTMSQVNLGFVVVSIFLGILVSIPYILIPTKRVMPGPLLLGVFISLIIANFNTILKSLITGSVNSSSIVCANDHTIADISSPACAITAIIGYTPGMFAICLWVCVTAGILIRVLHVNIPQRTQLIISFSFSALFPLIATIIFLSKKAVAGSGLGGLCGIDVTKDEGWYYAALFTIPIGIMLIIGTVCVLYSLLSIVYVSYRHGSDYFPLLSFLKSKWRILAYICCYWYAAVVAIGYWIYARIHQDAFATSIGGYYGCLYLTWADLVKNGTTPAVADMLTLQSCPHPYFPEFGPLLFVRISGHISIIIFSVLFLIDKSIYNFYHSIITSRKLPPPEPTSFTESDTQTDNTGSSVSKL